MSFASIHRAKPIPGFTGGDYYYVIYSQNMRKIISSRAFKQPHHARSALKRFLKIMGDVQIRPGIVQDKP